MKATVCSKRRYRDRVGALVALASTSYSKNARREETRAYRCPNCGGWHLTSRPSSSAPGTGANPIDVGL